VLLTFSCKTSPIRVWKAHSSSLSWASSTYAGWLAFHEAAVVVIPCKPAHVPDQSTASPCGCSRGCRGSLGAAGLSMFRNAQLSSALLSMRAPQGGSAAYLSEGA
jgi:hypothetical protein